MLCYNYSQLKKKISGDFLKNSRIENENDPVFPGENWFFYWKTSPSLWQSKIESYRSSAPLFVPIFWGYHCEYEDSTDFGSIKPESNLKKLFDIASSLGKSIVFLIPIMPMPFLPNGGLPSYVARTLAQDENGMVISVLDNESRLNKIYSFFEPKVFLAYKSFVYKLGQFFSENGISSHVYGCDCYRNERGRSTSFLDDYSQAFENGFSRFLQQQQTKVSSPEQELKLKIDYRKLISELYISSCEESLPANWGGIIRFCFLGSDVSNIFARSSDIWEASANYFKDIDDIITYDKLPSSVLLSANDKKGTLSDALKDLISTNYIHRAMSYSLFEDDVDSSFAPLFFFELISIDRNKRANLAKIDRNGLRLFLRRYYKSSYVFKEQFEIIEDDFESNNKIYYVWGAIEDIDDVRPLLKLFLNGAKIILDTQSLGIVAKKKLETFFLENNIQKESVSFQTQMDYVSIGEGKMVMLDSSAIYDLNTQKKVNFFQKLISFLNIKHLDIEADNDIVVFWKKRHANPMELDYEEIRRVSLYNPSSYKRKVRIVTNRNFALLKVLGEKHVKVGTSPIGIDLEMLPSGSVSFDFGYFE